MHTLTAEFLGISVTILDYLGRRWLTARDVGRCLGYAEESARHAILKLFSRHADEFGPEDQGVVNLTTPGGSQETRIFSQTGCILLAMFANTARAKEFRAWAKQALAAHAQPVVKPGHVPSRVRINRALERQVLEMFVAGLGIKSIARHLGIAAATAHALVHGTYRFSPAAGPDETTPELAQAVARELAARETERIAQKFCQSLANQQLVAALEAQGQRMLRALAAAEA